MNSGKTIEILNTDAEGRLVLADALAYAKQYEPDAVVDQATLTGAVVYALGKYAAGAMGTDNQLMEKVKSAAIKTHERGETALHAAVRGKAFEAASVLIKHGADVNATDHAEATPMYWAAVFDASEIMLLLLENGGFTRTLVRKQ